MPTDTQLVIFDTTLRDGEQSPGCTMHHAEKLRFAHQLAALGVDIIEAGFAIASDGDFAAIRAVAHEVRGPRIASLARCKREDIEAAARAVEAGATTINIPDTVGYTTPAEYKALFETVRARVPDPKGPGSDRIIYSTHCHDDLGMAVANSLAGVEGGARQIECTINGIGERAGNCSLEEVVMALRTRADRKSVV